MIDKIPEKRTSSCGALDESCIGKEAVLAGWVNRRRDHGGLIFIDLRDREGLTQVVFNPETSAQVHAAAHHIKNEYVVKVKGTVRRRPEGTENTELKTGMIEILADKLEILNVSKPVPFQIGDDIEVAEDIRLKYRYLDLRRPIMYKSLLARHKIYMATRNYMNEHSFLEVETPMLTKSTPEGSRDYLVPSRVNPGKFYALPQSPQLYKQILMVAGVEKYFQIVKCFRDEDLRADRQPEFTQIDVEMSFIDREDIYGITEGLIARIFAEAAGIKLNLPFPRLAYFEAMDKYGSDKPDLRFDMKMTDLRGALTGTAFNVFKRILEGGGSIKALRLAGQELSRSELDKITAMATELGASGLVWMRVTDKGVISPVSKFLSAEEISAVVSSCGAVIGDTLFIVADRWAEACRVLGSLRLYLGEKYGLIRKDEYNFLWVTDFPLLEYDEKEKRYAACHHPFTSPLDEDLGYFESDPGKIRAKAYDIVLNGNEIGGGSIRIHRREVQMKMFTALNMSEEEAKDKFGFLMDAFEYGAPPHGGIALGLDRIAMLIAKRKSIRDVIAFPKNQSAVCPLSNAPYFVSGDQLKELSIKLDLPDKD